MIKSLFIVVVIVVMVSAARNAYEGNIFFDNLNKVADNEFIGYLDESGEIHTMCNEKNYPLVTDENSDVIVKNCNTKNNSDNQGKLRCDSNNKSCREHCEKNCQKK